MWALLPERICGQPVNIGSGISLNDLASQINMLGRQRNIPVSTQLDQAKHNNGVTSLFNAPVQCLVVYHPNHRSDYYNYLFVQQPMNGGVFLSQYLGGNSSSFSKQILGKSMGGIFGGVVQRSGMAREQEEHAYYDAINDLVAQALSNLLSR